MDSLLGGYAKKLGRAKFNMEKKLITPSLLETIQKE
jgi:hypothetical protein